MKAEIFEYNGWTAITDPITLRTIVGVLLERSGFDVVGFMDFHFEPIGYTAVWVIKESHLAAHTFPEEGKTYLQLSSCSNEKHKIFMSLIAEISI